MTTGLDLAPGTFEVHTLSASDLLWSYDRSGSDALPTLPLYPHSRVTVDPFPCYMHQPGPLMEALAACMAVYPIPAFSTLQVHVAQHEEATRTNGFATYESRWVQDIDPACPCADDHNSTSCTCADGHWDRGRRHVFLGGKRTPIHPAMTRFVVAHEYGHQVAWWEAERRGLALHGSEVLDEYLSQVRPDQELRRDGAIGDHWHDAVGEVFACDFRTVLAGVETKHWPHYGVPRLTDAVLGYWAGVRAAVRHSGDVPRDLVRALGEATS